MRLSFRGSQPRMLTLPLSAILVPRMHSMVVLFPAPFAPGIPKTFPFPALMLKSSTAVFFSLWLLDQLPLFVFSYGVGVQTGEPCDLPRGIGCAHFCSNLV